MDTLFCSFRSCSTVGNFFVWASLLAQIIKNPPAMQETWVRSLGWEDLLEKGTATHSTILAWRIPWTEEAGGLQSMGSQRVSHDRSNLARMHAGTFLAGQWLRLCTSTAGVEGLIPSQGTEILPAAQHSQKKRKHSNSSCSH